MKKKIRYFVEAIFVYTAYYVFKLLTVDKASALGGKIGRAIGAKIKTTNTARKNIKNAMPEISDEKVEEIISGMWTNLGRVAGEFPHIISICGDKSNSRIKITGEENLITANENGKGFILFTGHFANWEVAQKIFSKCDSPFLVIYRHANNKFVDSLIKKSRIKNNFIVLPKGRVGAKGIIKQLKEKRGVAMLVDQKMNDGIEVPFFGRKAMTAPALAEFGKKFDAPLLPVQITRKEGAYFEITIYPALDIEDKSSYDIMSEVNIMFEKWIKDNPEQWFWVHNRWNIKKTTEVEAV